jgi:hypothetical protein
LSVRSFFSPSCETRELHTDPALRTRYYRNNFNQVVAGISTLAEKNQMEVKDVNNVHKEIYLLGNGFDVIVTVSQMTPVEAGIDFKVNMFSSMGFNRPRKKVVKFYEELKNILNFKGVSLHP